LDYEKTPRVCFKVEARPRDDDEFARILAQSFGERLGSVHAKKNVVMGSWAIVLQIGQQTFPAVLSRSKYGNDEWIMLIASPDSAGLFDRMRGRKEIASSPGLLQVCRDIHTVLTATAGISDVRWYFEGFRSQSAAVATPDELLWN